MLLSQKLKKNNKNSIRYLRLLNKSYLDIETEIKGGKLCGQLDIDPNKTQKLNPEDWNIMRETIYYIRIYNIWRIHVSFNPVIWNSMREIWNILKHLIRYF